ncbi:MAG: response regulator [Bacteroidales bacterium]
MSGRHKILYVDDEEINLLLFEMNFKEKYEVLIASDGFEGLELLKNHTDTEVIVSDMKMPGMNGVEFIRDAKRLHPEKKFFILTGFRDHGEIKGALEKGWIVRCFRKPMDMGRMHQIIAEALES